MNKCLKELYNIMKIQDWTSFNPEKDRVEALNKWISKWIVSVDQSQIVLNFNKLPVEHRDLVKYKLASDIAEHLAETCIEYKSEEHRINGTMMGLRREIKE